MHLGRCINWWRMIVNIQDEINITDKNLRNKSRFFCGKYGIKWLKLWWYEVYMTEKLNFINQVLKAMLVLYLFWMSSVMHYCIISTMLFALHISTFIKKILIKFQRNKGAKYFDDMRQRNHKINYGWFFSFK